jgi:hypothetical protein
MQIGNYSFSNYRQYKNLSGKLTKDEVKTTISGQVIYLQIDSATFLRRFSFSYSDLAIRGLKPLHLGGQSLLLQGKKMH